jgi:polyhydroxyalkanoate synthase
MTDRGANASRSALPEALQQNAARTVADFVAHLPQLQQRDLQELFAALAAHPKRLREIQERFYRDRLALFAQILDDSPAPAAAEGRHEDPRFAAPEWRTQPFFRLLEASYRLNASWLLELLDAAQLASASARRMRFVLRQLVDAFAPTNFPATNPEAIRRALETGGHSLVAGLDHLRSDLASGRLSMSEPGAFELGRNLAVTEGAVIHENPIAQLIQYRPRQPRVHARPLLVVPPFINKYYILDLQPHNSFVRFALDQGLQVFLLSWRNIPTELGGASWDDYIRQGVLEPLEAVLEVSRARSASALGFCVGGTLLATALAVMPRPARVANLTLLATMLDYTDVGDIGVYVDEVSVRQVEREHAAGGRVPGARLAAAFASLRANELIWHFVVDNYLLGRTPRPFDLLHWNGDSANLPGRLYAWYLRNLYLENSLRVPGRLRLCGRAVDLRRLRMPTYLLAAREDHIVPWRSAYASTRLLSGRIEFVLGASGHVAGVVNPPAAGRRQYWVNPELRDSADDWLANAAVRPGSWWGHWAQWLLPRSGRLVAAPRALGSVAHAPVEAAPGRYVREQPH